MNARLERIEREPWLAEVPDIIELAAQAQITLTPRQITGQPGSFLIDDMEWYEWLDAMRQS